MYILIRIYDWKSYFKEHNFLKTYMLRIVIDFFFLNTSNEVHQLIWTQSVRRKVDSQKIPQKEFLGKFAVCKTFKGLQIKMYTINTMFQS